VRASRQGLRISGKQVGEVPARAVVASGQGLPQAAGRGGIAPAQPPSHDAPASTLDSQPEPAFTSSGAHKQPHFLEIETFPLLLLRLLRPSAGQGGARRLRFFCPLGHRPTRHARHAHDAPLRVALGQQPVHLGIAGRAFERCRHKAGLGATGFILIVGMPAAVPVAPNVFTAAASASRVSRHHTLHTHRILD